MIVRIFLGLVVFQCRRVLEGRNDVGVQASAQIGESGGQHRDGIAKVTARPDRLQRDRIIEAARWQYDGRTSTRRFDVRDGVDDLYAVPLRSRTQGTRSSIIHPCVAE